MNYNRENFKSMNKGAKILMWVGLGILFVIAFTFITMSLWNWLVPELFNGPVLSFWQALGLLVLSKIIFGFGGKGGGSRGARWKEHYMRKKMMHMSPEDRENFKAKMWEKWCHRDKNSESASSGQTNV